MYTLPNSRSNMPINRLSDIAAWVTPRIQKSNNLPRCRCMSTQLLPRTQCCLPGKWANTIVGHTWKSFPICLDEPLCQQPPSFFLIYIFFKHSVISWTNNIHVVAVLDVRTSHSKTDFFCVWNSHHYDRRVHHDRLWRYGQDLELCTLQSCWVSILGHEVDW